MVEGVREGRGAAAVERLFIAYDELTKTIDRSEGARIEDIQAAVEFLLDAVKVARKDGPRLICRPEPLLRVASGSRQCQ